VALVLREGGFEESGQTVTDGHHPPIHGSGGRGPAHAVGKLGIS
jgi:hypothetical protein